VSVMTATFEEMMPYVFGPVDGDSDGNGDDDGENGVGDDCGNIACIIQ